TGRMAAGGSPLGSNETSTPPQFGSHDIRRFSARVPAPNRRHSPGSNSCRSDSELRLPDRTLAVSPLAAYILGFGHSFLPTARPGVGAGYADGIVQGGWIFL